MAFLQSFRRNIFKTKTNLIKLCSTFNQSQSEKTEKKIKVIPKPKKETKISDELLREITECRRRSDMPVEIENPFTPEKPKCLLCKYNIEPSYKNVRLLSQFVSTYTGRVYGRHITGLCKEKQEKLELEIRKAQTSGLMGVYVKDPNFINDPDLYDPGKPFRVL